MWDDEGNYLGPADDTDLTGMDTQDTVLDITADDVADSSFPEMSEPPPTEGQVPTYMFDEPPPEADFMPTHIPDEPAPSVESMPTGPAPDEPPPTEYNFFETAVDQAVEPPYEPVEPAPTAEQVQASTPPDEPPPVAAIAAADLPTSPPPIEPPPVEPLNAESVPTGPVPEQDTLGRAVEFGLQAASYTPLGQIIKATEDPLVAGLLNALQIPQRAIFGGIAGLARGENVLEGAAKGIADPSFGGGALLDVLSEETGISIPPVVHAVGSVILDVVADPVNLTPFGAAGKALAKVPLLRRIGQSKLMAEEIDAANLVTDLFADNLDAVTLSQEFVARPVLDAFERILPDSLKQFVTRDDAGKYALKSQQLARATSYINAKELTPEDLIKLSEGVELPITSELPENVLRSIREMEPEIKRFVKDTPKAREATQVAVTALKQLDPTGAQFVQDAFDEGNLERLLVLAHASGDQALEKSLKTLSDRWDGVLPTNVLDAAAHSRLSKWMNKENIRLPDPNIAHDLYQAFKQGYLYLSPRYHVNNQLDFVGKFFVIEGGSIKSLFNLDDVHNALDLPKTARQIDIQAGSIALSDDPLNRRVGWEKMPLGVGDAIRWVGQKVQGVGELFDSRVIVKQRTLEAYQITRKAVIPKLDKYFNDVAQLATSPEEAQLVTGIQQKVMGAIKSGRLLSMNDLKQLGGEIKLGKVLNADWVTGPPAVFGANGTSFGFPPTNSQVSGALKLLDDELRKGLQTQGQASAAAKKVFDDAIKEVGLAHKKQLAHLQAQKIENLPEIQFELFAAHQRAMSALQDAEHPQHILEGLRAFRWTEDLSAGIAKATREQVERLTADLVELKKTDLVKAGYMEDIIHDLWENSDRARVEAWTEFLESVDDLLANPISGGPPELLRAAKAARNQVHNVVSEQNRQAHAALDALTPKRKKGAPPVVETPEAAAARIAKRGAIFDAREAPILKAVRDAVAGLEGGFRAVGVDPDVFSPAHKVGKVSIGTSPLYHGTAESYTQIDPSKLSSTSLAGPGLYLTDNPRVGLSGKSERPGYAERRQASKGIEGDKKDLADLIRDLPDIKKNSPQYVQEHENAITELRDKIAKKESSGPRLVTFQVPNNLNLFDMNPAVNLEVIGHISNALGDFFRSLWERTGAPFTPEQVKRRGEIFLERLGDNRSGATVYESLVLAASGLGGNRATANKVLANIGYDGIRYEGGRISPMLDEFNKPVLHNVIVVFEDSLGKLNPPATPLDVSSTALKAHARKMAADALDDAESALNTNTTEILDYLAAWRTKALAELPQALKTPLQAVPPELVDRTLKRVYSTWTNLLEHSAHFGDTETRRILNDYQSGKTKIDHALNLISPFSMWQLRNISYYGDAMIRNPRIPYVVGKYLELSESEREKSGKPLSFLGSLPVGKPGGVFGENEVWINPVSPFLTGLQQAYQLVNAKQRYDNAQKFGSEADKSKAAAELAGAAAGGLSLYSFVQEILTFFGFFGDKAVQVPLPRFPAGETIEAGATLQPVPSVLKLFESLGVDPLGALTGWMIGEQRKRMPTLVPPTENNPTLQTMVERVLLADVINGFLDYRTMMRALDSRTRETDTVFLGAKSRARLLVDEEKRWKATAGSFSQMYRRVTPEMQAVYKAQQDQRAIEQNALGDTLYAGDLADNEYKRNLLFNTGSAEVLQAYRGTYVESDEEKRLLASYDEWLDMDPKARRNYLAQPDNTRLVAFLAWRQAQTDKSKDSVRDYIKEKQPTKPPEPFEVAGLGARGGIAPVAGSVTLRGELPAQTEVRRLEAIEKIVDAYNSFSTPEIRKVQEGKYPSGKAFYDALRAAGVYDRYTQLQKDKDAFIRANPIAALWAQFSDEEGARAKMYGLDPLKYSETLTEQTGLSKTKRFVQWATITGTMGIIDGTQIVKPGGGTQNGTTSGLPAVITSKAQTTTGGGTGTATTRPTTSTSRPATTPYVAPRGTTGYFTGNYNRGGGGGGSGGSGSPARPTPIYKLPPSGPYVPLQVVNPRAPVNPDVERTKAQDAYNTLSADQRVELKSGQPLSSKTEIALRQLWSRLGVLMPFLEWLSMIRTLQ